MAPLSKSQLEKVTKLAEDIKKREGPEIPYETHDVQYDLDIMRGFQGPGFFGAIGERVSTGRIIPFAGQFLDWRRSKKARTLIEKAREGRIGDDETDWLAGHLADQHRKRSMNIGFGGQVGYGLADSATFIGELFILYAAVMALHTTCKNIQKKNSITYRLKTEEDVE